METKGWIEISALLIAAASAGFAGWQSFLLNQTINHPFQANLQNRQIDACIEVILEYQKYSRARRLRQSSHENTLDQRKEAIDREASMAASATKLSILGKDETDRNVVQLRAALTKELGTEYGIPGFAFSDELIESEGNRFEIKEVSSVKEAFSVIQADCEKAIHQGEPF